MRRRLLRSWIWKPTVDDEVDGELAFHREMRLREYLARGLTLDQATRAVEARFGDIGRARSTCRQLGRERDRILLRHEYFAVLRQDLRYGLRQLWKNPGFACVAALTLALGIGGTAAIFSVVNAVVWRPLWVREPDRLVWLFETGREITRGSVSVGNFVEWSRRTTAFEAMSAIQWTSFNVTEGDMPERVVGARVTGRFFEILGVPPTLGRTFGEAEASVGREMVVVLSERLWARRFARDPRLIGRPIRLNGQVYTVLGVMPQTIDVMSDSEELWTPLVFTPEQRTTFDNHFLSITARLKTGATISQGSADVERVAAQLAKEHPHDLAERGAMAMRLGDLFAFNYRQRLFVLLGAVGLVLLIACANVANLLLARGAVRSTELAIRAALGAGRRRLIRQLLTESALLGGVGAAAGLLLAWAGLASLVYASPPRVPRLDQARLDTATFVVTALLALGSSLLFGMAPAWRGTRASAPDALRAGRSGGLSASRDRVRTALVAAEVALALVLLIGAGLLIRTALALDRVDPGFDVHGVLSARVTLPKDDYLEDRRVVQTLERMVDETRAVAGVTHAAVVSQVPFGSGFNLNGLIPEGRPLEANSAIQSRLRLASSDYFETMGIAIRQGRGFLDSDRHREQKVMIISEGLARQAWPTESAIDKRITCCEPGPGGPGTPDFKVVVGVAADVRSNGPGELPVPEFYLPIAQAPGAPSDSAWDGVQRTMYIVARTPGDAAALAGPVGQALRRVDPNLPLFSVRTMEQRMAGAVATSRFNTVLLTTLGVLGLLLSAIGIYGVIAYFVGQRTQEIGVRLALGAAPADVVRLVLRQAIRPVLVGLVLGVGVALAATRLLTAQLYGVGPRDPWTIAGVSLAFVVVAVLASWIPARRAAAVDPTSALNQG